MQVFEGTPVIAAIWTADMLKKAIDSPASTLFMLRTDILTLGDDIQQARRAGKKTFVHIDLTDGLGKDYAGVSYLARMGVSGIISTRANLIRLARELDLETVQRFFIVDSHSIDTAVDSVNFVHPDMVEVMPGVVPKIIHRFCMRVKNSVIAGGLIETREEIIAACEAGAAAVSTTKEELWYTGNIVRRQDG